MASNLRIVADNAIERAVVTASNTAGLLVASNLQTTDKSEIWRGLGKTERLTAIWPTAELLQFVGNPFCNWSPTSTMRVRLTNEPQVTNLFLYSEQFDAATWSKNSYTTVTGTNTLAPDGTNTAETLQGAGGSNSYAYQGVSLAAGGAYPVSCFVKAGTHTGDFQIHDFTENGTVVMNLTSLSVSANGTFTNARVDTIGGGWYRLSAIIRPTVAGNHNVGVWCVTSTGTVFVWGAMLASGSGVLTSYYPSLGTPGVRPLGYIDSWQSYDYDSGWVLACPAPAIKLRGWTADKAASAYAYGGGAYARHWMPAAKSAIALAVDIADPNNLQGYVEAACMVAGPVWAPRDGASDAPMTLVDTTTPYRTDAGSWRADAGYKYRQLPLDLSMLAADDRATLAGILRNSRAYPILIGLYAGWADLALERDHLIYGGRSEDSKVAIEHAVTYSTTITIEEI